MTNMKVCNYIISVISAALGIGIFAMSLKLGIGFKEEGGIEAGTWPGIMGAMLIICGIILLVMTLMKQKKFEAVEVQISLPANIRVYIFMGVFVVYCVLLTFLGFYISSVILIPVIMLLLGDRNKLKIALVTVCTLVSVFVIFQLVLGTDLPMPFFM